jgi:GNAT superfamily N-acetyltransferase
LDGNVVGLATGRVDSVGEASVGVVDALYVEPQNRTTGVGQKLLESLVGWFETCGCGSVDATALPGDRATKNFFESSGFKARLITMNRRTE